MILPPCGDCAFMARTAAAAHSMEPVRFTATVASQSARLISSTEAAGPNTPALLNSTSTRPQRWRAAAKSRSTSSGTVTSQGTASAWACPAPVSSSCASRRPASTTRYPSASMSRATALPIPEPAPVTTATRPGKCCRVIRLAYAEFAFHGSVGANIAAECHLAKGWQSPRCGGAGGCNRRRSR